MNFFLKKSNLGLLIFLLLAGMATYLACEQEILTPKDYATTTTYNETMLVGEAPEIADFEALPTTKPVTPFDFKVVMTKCRKAQPAVTLEVVMIDPIKPSKRPMLYNYEWIVDGAVVGHNPVLSCFCAPSATVIVTRIAEKQRVSKTVRLLVCNPKEPVPNYWDQ